MRVSVPQAVVLRNAHSSKQGIYRAHERVSNTQPDMQSITVCNKGAAHQPC